MIICFDACVFMRRKALKILASLAASASILSPVPAMGAENSALIHIQNMDTSFCYSKSIKGFERDVGSSRAWYGIRSYKCLTEKYSDGKIIHRYTVSYRMTKSQAKKAWKTEKAIAQAAIRKGRKNDNDLKYIYNTVKKVKYHQGGTFDYTPYGALIRKKSSCEGIALAFYDTCMLARRSAKLVQCKVNGDNHLIVSVKTGKKWYYYDPTWDIGSRKSLFFKKSKAYMQKRKHSF